MRLSVLLHARTSDSNVHTHYNPFPLSTSLTPLIHILNAPAPQHIQSLHFTISCYMAFTQYITNQPTNQTPYFLFLVFVSTSGPCFCYAILIFQESPHESSRWVFHPYHYLAKVPKNKSNLRGLYIYKQSGSMIRFHLLSTIQIDLCSMQRKYSYRSHEIVFMSSCSMLHICAKHFFIGVWLAPTLNIRIYKYNGFLDFVPLTSLSKGIV